MIVIIGPWPILIIVESMGKLAHPFSVLVTTKVYAPSSLAVILLVVASGSVSAVVVSDPSYHWKENLL